MKLHRIRDNSSVSKEALADLKTLIARVANKTLGQLEREGIFVFPETIREADDITREQMILQSRNNDFWAGNVMGFLGCGDERLVIASRFAGEEEDFFFQYLLNRVMEVPNLVDLETDADHENQIFRFLLFLFPEYLKAAMRKGLFKTYIRRRYNDGNIRGVIEVARHVRVNTPFTGKVAYSQREFSYDNALIELVRHTIEFIKGKPYGRNLLTRARDEVRDVITATPAYAVYERQRVIEENRTNLIHHAYYREYLALQKLCLLILRHQQHRIGYGTRQIYGILFDGAWLWEEYVGTLIGDLFYHPMNKAGAGAQRLFSGNTGLIYPDFIGRDSGNRVIADAKYKPLDHIGNKDYLQVLAYMFRFDARTGYYLYPEAGNLEDLVLWLNRGTTYEKNVAPREDIRVVKHGLRIPTAMPSYEAFEEEMALREREFRRMFEKEADHGGI